MNILSKEELMDISGGGISWALIAGGIVAFGAFVAGVIDGYLRPYKCR